MLQLADRCWKPYFVESLSKPICDTYYIYCSENASGWWLCSKKL